MKHLYLATDNALNFIIIRDMSRGDDDTAIVNWDLSEEEIEDIKNAFAEDENDESFYEQEPDWETFEEVMHMMNGFEHIG